MAFQGESLLPNVLDVAKQYNLEINPKTLNKKEVRCKCPFCKEDANRRNKYYLSLNPNKNVFKCWYCKESGGVLRFISLLTGRSENELIEKIRKKHGNTTPKHPAERLTKHQLSLIGYEKVDWYKNQQYDSTLAYQFRQKVWETWQKYVADRKTYCYELLFAGLFSGFEKSVEEVQEIEKELNVKFLDELLEKLFQDWKDDDVFELETLTCELIGRVHPYDTIDIKNEEEKGEEQLMLNNCTFVGRLSSDVDLKYTPNGNAVAQFSLALTKAVPDQNGERKADFIRCIAWGKVAENMANQLSKGDTIGFQSRVQTRSYENQTGQKVYVTEFVVEGFPTFIKVKKWESGKNNKNAQSQNAKGNNVYSMNRATSDPFFHGEPIDISSDDLPF